MYGPEKLWWRIVVSCKKDKSFYPRFTEQKCIGGKDRDKRDKSAAGSDIYRIEYIFKRSRKSAVCVKNASADKQNVIDDHR